MKFIITKIQHYSLYLFVFLLPWQTIFILREVFFVNEKWQYGTIGLYISDILLVALLALNFIFSRKLLFKYLKKNKNISFCALLFILFNFFSVTWSLDQVLATYSSINLFFAICLFFILQVSDFDKKILSLSFIVSMFFQSIIGFFQFITQSTFSFKYLGLQYYDIWRGGTSIITSESGRWIRSYGGEAHPNILALLLLTAILLSIYLYTLSKKKSFFLNAFLLLSISLFTATMLFTFSRNILVAFLIGFASIIVFLFFKYKHLLKRILLPLILIFLTTFSFVFIYKDLFFTRVSHDTLSSHNSISDRALYIQHSRALLKKNLFIGTGIGNYTNSIYDLEEKQHPIWNYQPVHNIYILILVELGLIGFFLLSLFIIFNLKNIFLPKNKIDFSQFIFLIIFLLFLLTSLLDHFLWTSHVGLFLLFLIFGISVKSISPSNHRL